MHIVLLCRSFPRIQRDPSTVDGHGTLSENKTCNRDADGVGGRVLYREQHGPLAACAFVQPALSLLHLLRCSIVLDATWMHRATFSAKYLLPLTVQYQGGHRGRCRTTKVGVGVAEADHEAHELSADECLCLWQLWATLGDSIAIILRALSISILAQSSKSWALASNSADTDCMGSYMYVSVSMPTSPPSFSSSSSLSLCPSPSPSPPHLYRTARGNSPWLRSRRSSLSARVSFSSSPEAIFSRGPAPRGMGERSGQTPLTEWRLA